MAPNLQQSADAFGRKSLVFMKFVSCSIVKVWIPTYPIGTSWAYRKTISISPQTLTTIEAIL